MSMNTFHLLIVNFYYNMVKKGENKQENLGVDRTQIYKYKYFIRDFHSGNLL